MSVFHLGIVCACVPWFYGPYGQQSLQLAQYLYDTYQYQISWFVYESQPLPQDKMDKYPWVRFHRIGKAPWIYISELNAEFRKASAVASSSTSISAKKSPPASSGKGRKNKNGELQARTTLPPTWEKKKIDAFVTMMDMNRIFVDEPFEPVAVSWFPNHWEKLDIHSRHALSQFEVVCPLAPSDAVSIQEQLPHKVVRHVPHVIRHVERDKARAHDKEVGSPREEDGDLKKAALRKKFGVPPRAFIVLVVFSNYDRQHNRKMPDMSLAVFRELYRESVRNGTAVEERPFLYVHALKHPDLQKEQGSEGMPMHLIWDSLQQDGEILPIRVNEDEMPYADILQLPQMADVFLHPAKAEGFGLPVLEAQLGGIPVVTTAFGAMRDYAMYGRAVPPNGPLFMELGFAAMPDFQGTLSALRDLHWSLTSIRKASGGIADSQGRTGRKQEERQEEVLACKSRRPREGEGRSAELDIEDGPRSLAAPRAASRREVQVDSLGLVVDGGGEGNRTSAESHDARSIVQRLRCELEEQRERAQAYIAANMSAASVGDAFHSVFASVRKPAYETTFRVFSYAEKVPKNPPETSRKVKFFVFVSPNFVIDRDKVNYVIKNYVINKTDHNATTSELAVTNRSTTQSKIDGENATQLVATSQNLTSSSADAEGPTLWVGSHYELSGGEMPRFSFGKGVVQKKAGSRVLGILDGGGASGEMPTLIMRRKVWRKVWKPDVPAVQIFQKMHAISRDFRYAGVVGVRRPTQQWGQGDYALPGVKR
ncbi:unnamed protein product [Amoebophrya sp. A120]|nr:unnamed protein product [Amoebophrya sp. A120]|eukprot:GSA120T00003291001.1